MAHSQTVREDGTALTPEKGSGRGIHFFLGQLSPRVDPVPGLERVTVVGVDLDGRVHLMHLLLTVWVNVYSTQRRLFDCLGNMPAEGLPLVVEIPDEAFAARRSVCTVPRVNHVTHLGGISLLDCQAKTCERAMKLAGMEYVELAFQGLTFAPLDCAYWLFSEGGGQTPQSLQGVGGYITPANGSRASL